MNVYQAQWDHLSSAWKQGRNPQSILFVGGLDCTLADFTMQFSKLILCRNKTDEASEPCQICLDCQMAERREHPDVTWIRPEKIGGPIKIDQIRELQNYSYLTPQRANQRLIGIESADRMNTAAANALLKILEEPAPHTIFLLMAQQLSTVLPTILSRCQVFRFLPQTDFTNLLSLSEQYPEGSEQAMIMSQAEAILDGLIAVIERREHPCVIAAQWKQYELSTLLWLFYLVYSQIQIMQVNKSLVTGPVTSHLNKLASLLNATVIFSQIDKINALQRKLSHNMNVNHTLVLEDLLFDL